MEDILWERALSPDESRDATFVLTGADTWVGKPAYLTADPLTIQEGQWEIAQAVPNARKRQGAWASTCESVDPTTTQI